jgi:hypothetical protein
MSFPSWFWCAQAMVGWAIAIAWQRRCNEGR